MVTQNLKPRDIAWFYLMKAQGFHCWQVSYKSTTVGFKMRGIAHAEKTLYHVIKISHGEEQSSEKVPPSYGDSIQNADLRRPKNKYVLKTSLFSRKVWALEAKE
jgi:hypothetical protein